MTDRQRRILEMLGNVFEMPFVKKHVVQQIRYGRRLYAPDCRRRRHWRQDHLVGAAPSRSRLHHSGG